MPEPTCAISRDPLKSQESQIYSGEVAPCELSVCYPDDKLDLIAWFCGNAGAQSHAVGQREPNGWGLYDMIGNVFEWAHSEFTPSGYGDAPLVDPGGEVGEVSMTAARTRRGCGYYGWNSLCRAAERSSATMTGAAPAWGFRLVRTLAD